MENIEISGDIIEARNLEEGMEFTLNGYNYLCVGNSVKGDYAYPIEASGYELKVPAKKWIRVLS